ncbi:hypothetical protein [Sphingosinicella sp. BN140058]|uniref:hypothetical protein n=1 Tax=Sphingosinicella sp. BN140058 TaxID=1892855 RepID=UPI001013BAF4|nr:hypothetical protein [Sphingosinicella sp. BN140058]QAY77320.1 hypothetical protein ETR14_13015 [Sphingosinicella sp. BN140058]
MKLQIAPLLLLPILGACVAKTEGTATTAPRVQLPPPRVYSVVGLETVIGRTARVIEAQFGRPELDVREGSARKLQFSGPACVLDVYFYPPRGGGDPIVIHVDARLPDGRDFDRASCVAALGKATQHR